MDGPPKVPGKMTPSSAIKLADDRLDQLDASLRNFHTRLDHLDSQIGVDRLERRFVGMLAFKMVILMFTRLLRAQLCSISEPTRGTHCLNY